MFVCQQRDTLRNTQLAIHLAEENGVPALLDASDLVATSQKRFDEATQSSIYEVTAPSVDEFSLVVYLSMLYQVCTHTRINSTFVPTSQSLGGIATLPDGCYSPCLQKELRDSNLISVEQQK